MNSNFEYIYISKVKPNEAMEMLQNHIYENITNNYIDVVTQELYRTLQDLINNYKNFESWYFETVVREMSESNGEKREIIVLCFKEEDRLKLAAIAIVKNKIEKKICTFRVLNEFRGCDVAEQLFEECFRYLGDRKPLFTVPESVHKAFLKYIKLYDFELTQKLENHYSENSTEYVYNGKLID